MPRRNLSLGVGLVAEPSLESAARLEPRRVAAYRPDRQRDPRHIGRGSRPPAPQLGRPVPRKRVARPAAPRPEARRRAAGERKRKRRTRTTPPSTVSTVVDASPLSRPADHVGERIASARSGGRGTIRVLFAFRAQAGSEPRGEPVRPPTPFTVSDGATQLTVKTSKLQAQVGQDERPRTFLDAAGSVLPAEGSGRPSPAHAGQDRSFRPSHFGSHSRPRAASTFTGFREHQQQQPGKLAYGGVIQLLQKNLAKTSVLPCCCRARATGCSGTICCR